MKAVNINVPIFTVAIVTKLAFLAEKSARNCDMQPISYVKGFGFGGGVRYIGETFGDWANTTSVPAYTLFDGVVDYEIDDWRLAVNVTNIGDTETLTCSDTCYYGADRTIIASIRRRW